MRALEIKIVKEEEEGVLLNVPPYRVDVRREADVIEDILRIYGFNNVEVPAKVNSTLSYSEKPDDFRLKNLISDLLAANGFNEVMNNSLTKASYFEETKTYQPEHTVMLYNPAQLRPECDASDFTFRRTGKHKLQYQPQKQQSEIIRIRQVIHFP